ncbi:hypothetical protein SLEP1_g53248 [Rubroshorea leprosula]|uniref:Uncharacterized protein n=1 Tax=Rubroshorea leprosula TaxID=152421 RepID=A0AAV5M8W3_9ROSI|nr:hypothetical protein SLEP1_g53248 [Rubroshorea leprosula]
MTNSNAHRHAQPHAPLQSAEQLRHPILLHRHPTIVSANNKSSTYSRTALDLPAKISKINHTNTWELKLIDHLCDIVKVDAAEADSQTNFQRQVAPSKPA